MTGLRGGQEGDEGPQNFIIHERDQFGEQDIEVLVRSHRLWWQRYSNGEIETHFHLRFRSGWDLCSVERALSSARLAPPRGQFGLMGNSVRDEAHVVISPPPDDVQRAVFVETVEFMDDRQRVPNRVWSHKWLQPLERCVGGVVLNSSNLPQPTPLGGLSILATPEVLQGILKDGELGVCRRVSRSSRQIPNDVIQDTPEVVDTVSGKCGPSVRDVPSPLHIQDACGLAILGDDMEGVRLFTDKAIQLGLESAQVLFRPIKFDAYVV
jgi:hypothetical protein